MKTNKKMEQTKIIFTKYGQKAFEMAKNAILQEKNIYERVYEALRYFMEEFWYDVQHPALISLACEAVGGNPNDTTQIGAAIVLLAGAADIHDDIIDKSIIKDSKPTVFGKFGANIALLTGDALLFKGSIFLHDVCTQLPKKLGKEIVNMTKEAFFKIGSAEANEINFKGNYHLNPRAYLNIIKMKTSVAETSTRIGAIIGGGGPKEIKLLGDYGRTLGFLMTIRDEFIDIFESKELENRTKNECLPLPLLYAIQDTKMKNKILPILKKGRISELEVQKILGFTMRSKKVQKLKNNMKLLIEKQKRNLNFNTDINTILSLLLEATLEDL
ncbi:MAG: polyprenyl synthetase family protein [Candidatus Bathyarchaeales archaeon]